MIKTVISVSASIDAIHKWPEAPGQVFFLRHPHRHIFIVTVDVEVTASRQYEFFILQEAIVHAAIACGVRMTDCVVSVDYGEQSCEQIAAALLLRLHSYPVVRISVSEDGENSAELTRTHE